MKVLRIYIKGSSHIRWGDMPIPDATTMATWTKVMEQQGCIVAETFMVPRESMEMMAIFENVDAPQATIMPFHQGPKPVA